MTKRIIIQILYMLFIFIFIFISGSSLQKRSNLNLFVFKVNSGWGYQILYNGKTILYQPYIPVIEGTIPFHSENDARNVGLITIKKILVKKRPIITKQELIEAGVII